MRWNLTNKGGCPKGPPVSVSLPSRIAKFRINQAILWSREFHSCLGYATLSIFSLLFKGLALTRDCPYWMYNAGVHLTSLATIWNGSCLCCLSPDMLVSQYQREPAWAWNGILHTLLSLTIFRALAAACSDLTSKVFLHVVSGFWLIFLTLFCLSVPSRLPIQYLLLSYAFPLLYSLEDVFPLNPSICKYKAPYWFTRIFIWSSLVSAMSGFQLATRVMRLYGYGEYLYTPYSTPSNARVWIFASLCELVESFGQIRCNGWVCVCKKWSPVLPGNFGQRFGSLLYAVLQFLTCPMVRSQYVQKAPV